MRALFKGLCHIALARRDLFAIARPHLQKPPMLGGWHEELVRIRGVSGGTLLDTWRSQFEDELNSISAKPTWHSQRSQLIKFVLDHTTWCTLYSAAQNVDPRTWHHYLVEHPQAHALSPEDRSGLITKRYILALMSHAALLTIGQRVYSIDEAKQREIEAYGHYEKETRQLDVSMMALLFDAIDSKETETVDAIAAYKDQTINPLLQAQVSILAKMADEIVHGRVDVNWTMARVREIHAAKLALAQALGGISEEHHA